MPQERKYPMPNPRQEEIERIASILLDVRWGNNLTMAEHLVDSGVGTKNRFIRGWESNYGYNRMAIHPRNYEEEQTGKDVINAKDYKGEQDGEEK